MVTLGDYLGCFIAGSLRSPGCNTGGSGLGRVYHRAIQVTDNCETRNFLKWPGKSVTVIRTIRKSFLRS